MLVRTGVGWGKDVPPHARAHGRVFFGRRASLGVKWAIAG